jgi:ElaB/YqjD/DUF883 family membrane-anchored ribosome-binding protein
MHFSAESFPEHETPEQIAAHIDELMAEAEAMLEGPVVNPAQPEVLHLKTRLAEARAGLGDLFGLAHQQVTAGARFTDETIRAHPYSMMAAALGVGVAIGALLRGSSRRQSI